MEHLINEIEKNLTKMEVIINQDTYSFDDEEKLQDLYVKVQTQLQEITDYCNDEDEKSINKIKKLKKRFKQLSSEFENPDDIIEGTLNMMNPDRD